MGLNSPPFQGKKVDAVTWSPFLSAEKDFVSVGQEDTCVNWTSRMPNAPNLSDQSLPGGGVTFSKYILCCNHVVGISDQIEGQAQAQTSPALSSKPTSEVVPDEVGQIYAQVGARLHPACRYLSLNLLYVCESSQAAQTYKPVFYNRESGYNGVSYSSALDFCNSKITDGGERMTLCNFESLCPLGTDSVPVGGVKTDPGGAWVPIIEKEWVSVSSGTKCMPYSFLHPDKPNLGQGGGDIPQVTSESAYFFVVKSNLSFFAFHLENVMCCLWTAITHEVEPESSPASAPSINVPVVASSPMGKTLAPASGHDESIPMSAEEVNDIFQPIWYVEICCCRSVQVKLILFFRAPRFDRDSGWKGRTWQEGQDFCHSQQNSFLWYVRLICTLSGLTL